MPTETSPAQGEQRRRIVDAQVHLWKAERRTGPGCRRSRKCRNHSPSRARADDGRSWRRPRRDRAAVWPSDRNDYALEAAKRYPDRFAVMGRIPLQESEIGRAAADMEAAARHARRARDVPRADARLAHRRHRRIGSGRRPRRRACRSCSWRAGKVPTFARIAERHPQLTLIIDHMGLSVETVQGTARSRRRSTQAVALAKYPNVCVKLSSAPTNSLEAYPFRDMTPHIKRVFDAYGPQRCYWGTDITNSFVKASYRQRITHFTEELTFLSEERQGLGDGPRNRAAAEVGVRRGFSQSRWRALPCGRGRPPRLTTKSGRGVAPAVTLHPVRIGEVSAQPSPARGEGTIASAPMR